MEMIQMDQRMCFGFPTTQRLSISTTNHVQSRGQRSPIRLHRCGPSRNKPNANTNKQRRTMTSLLRKQIIAQGWDLLPPTRKSHPDGLSSYV